VPAPANTVGVALKEGEGTSCKLQIKREVSSLYSGHRSSFPFQISEKYVAGKWTVVT
jgi:hypothetical protein